MGFFTWIRTNVRNAVLGGFQDALEQLDETQPALEITLRVEPAAIEEDERKPRKVRS